MKNYRVVQVGNIANNAYLNSKILRARNIESDVICYDYYHVMGTPEWEDARMTGDYGNDFDPDWRKINLHKFKRPFWFHQGPLGKIAQTSFDINSQEHHNRKVNEVFFIKKFKTGVLLIESFLYKLHIRSYGKKNRKIIRYFDFLSRPISNISNIILNYFEWAEKQLLPKGSKPELNKINLDFMKILIREYNQLFPERTDILTIEDILPFLPKAKIFQKIFENYDIVQCYATDPIYAMLANKHPYIAFEHGTIRDIPFEKNALGRLTALAYRKADLVFITNADNNLAAEKLRIKNYRAIPHPINEHWEFKKKEFNLKTIKLFCPIRHDWKTKGTDLYIRAIPLLKQKLKSDFKMYFVSWGEEIENSEKLIKDLKVGSNIVWLKPLPRYDLCYWMNESDIVLDQLTLPHMGATAPQAMLAGKPVLMSYEPTSTRWMHPDAPIISVFTPEQIADTIVKLTRSPKMLEKIGEKGKKWYFENYSNEKVYKILEEEYQKLLKKR